jgi:2-C-methyl-D-erythritol 4-phosphate cytidylyltransferase
MSRITAIVPAAGLGTRFGPRTNKPFSSLLGKPLLVWVLEALEACPEVDDIIPVIKTDDMEEAEAVMKDHGFRKVLSPAPGGEERQDSVRNGLRQVRDTAGVVLIHDGVRPFLTPSLIRDTVEGLRGFDGAIAAVPPKDTIKAADAHGVVVKTLKRDELWSVQTPQVFPYETIMKAYESASTEGFRSTDDSALVERMGGRVNIVMGSYENIKITTPEDIPVAEAFAKRRMSG